MQFNVWLMVKMTAMVVVVLLLRIICTEKKKNERKYFKTNEDSTHRDKRFTLHLRSDGETRPDTRHKMRLVRV